MPEYATDARNLVTASTWGVLSTLSRRHGGVPFGSVAPYDIRPDGKLVILVASISEHYKNLSADGRASLTVSEAARSEDPHTKGRATVLLDFAPISDADAARAYHERFPQTRGYEVTHDFHFLAGTPTRVRWIGGFGEIGWVDGAEFAAARPDPLAYLADGMIRHMNEDHLDALADLVRSRDRGAELRAVRMVAATSLGFTVRTGYGEKAAYHRFDFPEPAGDSEAARYAIIALLREARKRLAGGGEG